MPRTIGSVKVDSLTGFSHAFSPQLLVASADVVVESARGTTTRLGTAISINDSILPIGCDPVGTRGPSLTIFDMCRFSIIAEGSWPKRQLLVNFDERASVGEKSRNRVRWLESVEEGTPRFRSSS